MAKIIKCPTCGFRYRSLEDLEDLRDNDGVCLQCNNEIEVKDWDRVLASFEDEDLDDVDDIDDEDEDEGWEDDVDEDDELELADDVDEIEEEEDDEDDDRYGEED